MENSTFYEGVIALSSVIVGIILSQGWEWIKKRKEEKENKEATKALIKLEIEQNKEYLKNYWTRVSKSKLEWFDEEGEFYYSQLGYTINDVPFPEFSNEGWRSQLNNIGKIYSTENLAVIWEQYQAFQRLREIRDHLLFLEDESERKGRQVEMRTGGSPISGLVKGLSFNEDAYNLAVRFEEITDTLIDTNNIEFKNRDV